MKASLSFEQRCAVFRFDGKPDAPIRSILKAHGFRWNPSGGLWWRAKISGAADVASAIDKALNPNRPDGSCWKCGDPGKLRAYGAATPVFCDRCEALNRAAEDDAARLAADDFDLANNRCM